MQVQVVLASKEEHEHCIVLCFWHWKSWAQRNDHLVSPDDIYKFEIVVSDVDKFKVGEQYRLKIGAKDE